MGRKPPVLKTVYFEEYGGNFHPDEIKIPLEYDGHSTLKKLCKSYKIAATFYEKSIGVDSGRTPPTINSGTSYELQPMYLNYVRVEIRSKSPDVSPSEENIDNFVKELKRVYDLRDVGDTKSGKYRWDDFDFGLRNLRVETDRIIDTEMRARFEEKYSEKPPHESEFEQPEISKHTSPLYGGLKKFIKKHILRSPEQLDNERQEEYDAIKREVERQKPKKR